MKKIIFAICAIFSFFNKFIHKKTILFYSNLGFRDNVFFLFDYYVKHSNNRRIVVCCNDYKKIKEEYSIYKSVKFHSDKFALFSFLRATHVFYSFGKVPIVPSKKQCTINLWHGMPLKTIGALAGLPIKKYYYSYQIITSDIFADPFKKAFLLKENSCVVLGQPRNDFLFKPNSYVYKDYKKIFIWMPTFRKSSKMNYVDIDTDESFPLLKEDDLFKINDLMKKNNSVFIIKIHPLQDFDGNRYNFSNIKILTEEDINNLAINLYSLLGASTCLITDYSSVYIDYLLIDKPIGFVISDIDEYKDNRGMMLENPLQFMPGKKIHNSNEFIDFIQDVFDENDMYANERRRVNDLFNSYKDDNSSKRIIDYFELN